MNIQGSPTEGIYYPCVVTLIVEHSKDYWACKVLVVGANLNGYTHKIPKETLLTLGATKVGTPLVLVKHKGRVKLLKAPPGSESLEIPGAIHLTKGPYPPKILAQFPRLSHDPATNSNLQETPTDHLPSDTNS